jgi:hypothetical protein
MSNSVAQFFNALGRIVGVSTSNPLPVTLSSGGGYAALGYEQIVGLAAATNLTVPVGTRLAIIVAEDQAVRYRDDGVSPTAAIGEPLAAGATLQYDGDAAAFAAIEFIEQAATATLNISYYG